jgi:ABC-type multidrug transport system fused ATPase/permease subunit
MLDAFKKLHALMHPRERRRTLLLFGMMTIMSLLETSGVASIMPFMAVLADPAMVETNPRLGAVYKWLGFGTPQDFLFFLGLFAFFALLVSTGFRALTVWAILRFTSMRNYTFSRRLFKGYLTRPYVWFLGRHSSDLGKTLLSEVSHVIRGALVPALQLIAQVVVAASLMILLLLVHPLLTLTISVFLCGSYWLIFWVRRRHLSRIGEDRVRANKERFRISSEAFGAIKEVKILGLEKSFLRRFEKPSLRYAKHRAASQLMAQLPQYGMQVIAFGGILLTVLYQLLDRSNLGTTLPLIALYALAGYRLLPALNQIYVSASTLRFALPAVEILHRELTEVEGQVTEKPATVINNKTPRLQHCLELRGISLRYPDATSLALNDISMSVPARSTVGLVGHSGAGKTTAADVMLGLLEPEKGKVLLDDTPITAENKRAWQSFTGYVPQHVFLIDASVTANIAFGVEPSDVDMSAVQRAARLANLHDFVMNELEDGYETLIGERGVRFSGGQRQRVGIARALYRDPELIVMDEATNALDNITERAVIDAVSNLRNQKTIILIAHRLTTVKRCDRIYIFEGGRIVASGTYEELVDSSMKFREMVEVGLR